MGMISGIRRRLPRPELRDCLPLMDMFPTDPELNADGVLETVLPGVMYTLYQKGKMFPVTYAELRQRASLVSGMGSQASAEVPPPEVTQETAQLFAIRTKASQVNSDEEILAYIAAPSPVSVPELWAAFYPPRPGPALVSFKYVVKLTTGTTLPEKQEVYYLHSSALSSLRASPVVASASHPFYEARIIEGKVSARRRRPRRKAGPIASQSPLSTVTLPPIDSQPPLTAPVPSPVIYTPSPPIEASALLATPTTPQSRPPVAFTPFSTARPHRSIFPVALSTPPPIPQSVVRTLRSAALLPLTPPPIVSTPVSFPSIIPIPSLANLAPSSRIPLSAAFEPLPNFNRKQSFDFPRHLSTPPPTPPSGFPAPSLAARFPWLSPTPPAPSQAVVEVPAPAPRSAPERNVVPYRTVARKFPAITLVFPAHQVHDDFATLSVRTRQLDQTQQGVATITVQMNLTKEELVFYLEPQNRPVIEHYLRELYLKCSQSKAQLCLDAAASGDSSSQQRALVAYSATSSSEIDNPDFSVRRTEASSAAAVAAIKELRTNLSKPNNLTVSMMEIRNDNSNEERFWFALFNQGALDLRRMDDKTKQIEASEYVSEVIEDEGVVLEEAEEAVELEEEEEVIEPVCSTAIAVCNKAIIARSRATVPEIVIDLQSLLDMFKVPSKTIVLDIPPGNIRSWLREMSMGVFGFEALVKTVQPFQSTELVVRNKTIATRSRIAIARAVEVVIDSQSLLDMFKENPSSITLDIPAGNVRSWLREISMGVFGPNNALVKMSGSECKRMITHLDRAAPASSCRLQEIVEVSDEKPTSLEMQLVHKRPYEVRDMVRLRMSVFGPALHIKGNKLSFNTPAPLSPERKRRCDISEETSPKRTRSESHSEAAPAESSALIALAPESENDYFESNPSTSNEKELVLARHNNAFNTFRMCGKWVSDDTFGDSFDVRPNTSSSTIGSIRSWSSISQFSIGTAITSPPETPPPSLCPSPVPKLLTEKPWTGDRYKEGETSRRHGSLLDLRTQESNRYQQTPLRRSVSVEVHRPSRQGSVERFERKSSLRISTPVFKRAPIVQRAVTISGFESRLLGGEKSPSVAASPFEQNSEHIFEGIREPLEKVSTALPVMDKRILEEDSEEEKQSKALSPIAEVEPVITTKPVEHLEVPSFTPVEASADSKSITGRRKRALEKMREKVNSLKKKMSSSSKDKSKKK